MSIIKKFYDKVNNNRVISSASVYLDEIMSVLSLLNSWGIIQSCYTRGNVKDLRKTILEVIVKYFEVCIDMELDVKGMFAPKFEDVMKITQNGEEFGLHVSMSDLERVINTDTPTGFAGLLSSLYTKEFDESEIEDLDELKGMSYRFIKRTLMTIRRLCLMYSIDFDKCVKEAFDNYAKHVPSSDIYGLLEDKEFDSVESIYTKADEDYKEVIKNIIIELEVFELYKLFEK